MSQIQKQARHRWACRILVVLFRYVVNFVGVYKPLPRPPHHRFNRNSSLCKVPDNGGCNIQYIRNADFCPLDRIDARSSRAHVE
jgi:hypothetical protein